MVRFTLDNGSVPRPATPPPHAPSSMAMPATSVAQVQDTVHHSHLSHVGLVKPQPIQNQKDQHQNIAGGGTADATISADLIEVNNLAGPLGLEAPQNKLQPQFRPAACVFVANLPANESEDQLGRRLTSLFGTCGKVLLVKVLRDRKDRPYAFVQFGTKLEADKAVTQGKRANFAGFHLRCEPARVNRTLFIKSAPGFEEPTVEDVRALTAPFGELEEVTRWHTTRDAGGWFVRFAYREDAARAYVALRTVYTRVVHWVQNLAELDTQADSSINNSIYVGRLSLSVTDRDLREYFGRFGKIVNTNLVQRPTEKGSFAHIEYTASTAVDQAVTSADHSVFRGHSITVSRRMQPFSGPRLAPPPVKAKDVFDSRISFDRHGSKGAVEPSLQRCVEKVETGTSRSIERDNEPSICGGPVSQTVSGKGAAWAADPSEALARANIQNSFQSINMRRVRQTWHSGPSYPHQAPGPKPAGGDRVRRPAAGSGPGSGRYAPPHARGGARGAENTWATNTTEDVHGKSLSAVSGFLPRAHEGPNYHQNQTPRPYYPVYYYVYPGAYGYPGM